MLQIQSTILGLNSPINSVSENYKIVPLNKSRNSFYSSNRQECNLVYLEGFEIEAQDKTEYIESLSNKFSESDDSFAIYSDSEELVGLGFYNYITVLDIPVIYERGIVLKPSVQRKSLSNKLLKYVINEYKEFQFLCGASHNPITLLRYKKLSTGEMFGINTQYCSNRIASILATQVLAQSEGFSNEEACHIITNCKGVMQGRYHGLKTDTSLRHNEIIPNIFLDNFSRLKKDAVFCLVKIKGGEHE
jgi:hypothetical protein